MTATAPPRPNMPPFSTFLPSRKPEMDPYQWEVELSTYGHLLSHKCGDLQTEAHLKTCSAIILRVNTSVKCILIFSYVKTPDPTNPSKSSATFFASFRSNPTHRGYSNQAGQNRHPTTYTLSVHKAVSKNQNLVANGETLSHE